MSGKSDIIFRRISRLMEETGTRYAIIGGVAVALYGVPRMTLDVDVNIVLQKTDIVEFLKRARRLGFLPVVRDEGKFAASTGVIPMKCGKIEPYERCDFIIAENLLEDIAINRARTRKIGSSKIRVITPEDLILQKLLSDRPRDMEDARGVMMRQKKLDKRYIRSWLRKISAMTKSRNLLKVFNSLVEASQ